MTAAADARGIISPEAVSDLAQRWETRLQGDSSLMLFLSCLGLDTGCTEALQLFFSSLPAYVRNTLTAGAEIRILDREDGTEVWHAAGRDFALLRSETGLSDITGALPATEDGYLPSFLLRRSVRGDSQSGQLALRILRQNSAEEALVDLQASADSLPLSWPADCRSLIRVSLTGALFANLGFDASLQGAADGRLTLTFRKPSLTEEPGATLVTLTGSLTPLARTEPLPVVTREEINQAVGLYSFTDHSLSDFMGKVLPTLVPGLLRFLFGIPTAACQVMLDDLTDTGILAMFIGE